MAYGGGLFGLPSSDAEVFSFIGQDVINKYGSVEELIKQARDGDATAQELVGLGYYHGYLGFDRDADKAIGWLEAAIANNSGPPKCTVIGSLATLYDTIKDGSVYKRKAYELYLKASKLGDPNSQLNLAEIYRSGLEGVVNEDMNEAFRWYRIAAGEEVDESSQNDPLVKFARTMVMMAPESKLQALRSLYKYYLKGDCPEGKPQPTKAVYYLNRAAIMGDVVSQVELGKLHMDGKCNLPKDLKKATEWFEKAKEKGDINAKELLVKCTKQMGKLKKPAKNTRPASKDKGLEVLKESVDILEGKLQQQGDANPYFISQPVFLNEEILSQWPDSPTAQTYLKAYRLFKKGLDILYNSNFTDPAGVTNLAQGIYIESAIMQCFTDQVNADQGFFVNVLTLIENTTANNANFFEGLAVLPLLFGEKCLNVESTLRDLKRISAIENVILLIEQTEPDSPVPCDIPMDCPGRYSGWLTFLYEYLASLYTVHSAFHQGFEAFENAVKLCPGNHEAKLGMAYCLLNIVTEEEVDKRDDPVLNQLNEASKARKGDPKYQLEEKDRFEDLGAAREKARELFIEYLKEAPKCAKKYPNGHYHLASLYMTEQNCPKFVEMYELAQKAEENRLPFLPQVETQQKHWMMPFYTVITQAQLQAPLQAASKCHYKDCIKKTSGGKQKACPCKNAFYCDRNCQVSDWKNHKHHCTAKKGKKHL